MKYEVHVTMDFYRTVEANDEAEAKKLAKEDACFFGDIYGEWDYEIEELEDD